MSFIGRFERYKSLRAGGLQKISFVITNNNIFAHEVFNVAINATDARRNSLFFYNIELKAKESFRFDFDTVDWDWCKGDEFVIVDNKNKVKSRWVLHLEDDHESECSVCHGSKKCNNCFGRGVIYQGRDSIEKCTICSGTGKCQYCVTPNASSQRESDVKRRHIENIRIQIRDLEDKIRRVEWDMRILQLQNINNPYNDVYMSHSRLAHQYKLQLIKLQNQLHQLENL